MTPDHKYDEALVRFLLKESTEEEEAFILKWIEEDVEHKLYLQSLVKTLDLISLSADNNKLDIDAEWRYFRERLHSTNIEADEGQDRNELDLAENRKNKKFNLYKLVISTAVAASIIFIVALQWGWFAKRNENDHLVKNNKPQSNHIDSLLAIKVQESNTTGKVRELVLPDGSMVALSNNSELIYQEPSERNKREIYLSGKADFKVAKDKSKPFIVFSESISTTAIGTRFIVISIKNEKQIRIRLEEGRIVVKPVKTGYGSKMKTYYLVPGQELVYNKNTQSAYLSTFTNNVGMQKGGGREIFSKENPSIPQFDKHSWFMFNNQPLNKVFDDLAEMYNTRIYYTKSDVQHISFIGTFDKSDSLESILKKIASINDLKLTKDHNSFRIDKTSK